MLPAVLGLLAAAALAGPSRQPEAAPGQEFAEGEKISTDDMDFSPRNLGPVETVKGEAPAGPPKTPREGGHSSIPAHFVSFISRKWHGGLIPIQFDDPVTPAQEAMVFDACAEWSKVANVRCVKRKRSHGDYLHIRKDPGRGCRASIGLQRPFFLKDVMNLKEPNCWNKRTILHEFGHTLGFIHEHQRSDRDRYVILYPENMRGGGGMEMELHLGQTKIAPYDFLSIMHYSATTLSRDKGLVTMEPRQRYIQYKDVMGTLETLSQTDAYEAMKLYGPPPKTLPADSNKAAAASE